MREDDTNFVPMEWVSNVNSVTNPSTRPIYYDGETNEYMQWTEEIGWANVDQSYYDWVIENKAYIDMPNIDHYVFLNPRDIFMGINISYDF